MFKTRNLERFKVANDTRDQVLAARQKVLDSDWFDEGRMSVTGTRYVCGTGLSLLVTVTGETTALPTEVELDDGTLMPIAYDHRANSAL